MELIGPEIRRKFDDALGSGDMLALFERTRKAIEQYPDDPDVRFLQALAMARLGDPHAALRIYERNRVEEIGTEDAVALKGRVLKDLAVRADGGERERLFRESSEAYQRANKLSDGYFSGINAATTSFLAGEKDRARKLATAIGERPDVAQPDNFFAAASGAEAMLVRGEIDEATALYAAARKRPDASPGIPGQARHGQRWRMPAKLPRQRHRFPPTPADPRVRRARPSPCKNTRAAGIEKQGGESAGRGRPAYRLPRGAPGLRRGRPARGPSVSRAARAGRGLCR